MNNTFRVATQESAYTFRAVICPGAALHNLWMVNARKKGPDLVALQAGERIKKARNARGWSQKELAKRTGWVSHKPSQAQPKALAPSRIANFEQGTRRVGYEEAQILAEAFAEMPPAYWMGIVSDQEGAVLAAMRHGVPPASAPIDRSAA